MLLRSVLDIRGDLWLKLKWKPLVSNGVKTHNNNNNNKGTTWWERRFTRFTRLKFDHTTKSYMHKPESVIENEMHNIFWDCEVQTDHLILARRPVLLFINNKKKKKIIIIFHPKNKLWNNTHRIGKKTAGIRNQRKSWDYLDHCSVKID